MSKGDFKTLTFVCSQRPSMCVMCVSMVMEQSLQTVTEEEECEDLEQEDCNDETPVCDTVEIHRARRSVRLSTRRAALLSWSAPQDPQVLEQRQIYDA